MDPCRYLGSPHDAFVHDIPILGLGSGISGLVDFAVDSEWTQRLNLFDPRVFQVLLISLNMNDAITQIELTVRMTVDT